MIKTSTILLGAGMLAASLAMPVAARADSNDTTLAFLVGTAVGHAVSDRVGHVRPVHRRYHGHGRDLRHFGRLSRQQRHNSFHRQLNREHRRFHGHGSYERSRDHRRHDRHDRRRDHGRDDHRNNRRHHS